MTSPQNVLARERALQVHGLLLAYYGEPELKEQLDPLSELVATILSQNTNDTNSGRAYESLRTRFPTWEQVLATDPRALADSIRVGGLANVKAPRIQAILRQLLAERGALSLDFIAEWPVEQARAYLLSLSGVGPKTAACVLLFSLHMPALPVDTHVHRVAQRVGLVSAKASAERAHTMLEELLPPELYYPFHLLAIQHGRVLCHARAPQCPGCPLLALCPFADQPR